MLKYFGGHPDAPNLSDEVGFVRLQGGDKREGCPPAFGLCPPALELPTPSLGLGRVPASPRLPPGVYAVEITISKLKP